MKVTEWITVEDGCGATRAILGKDPDLIENRVAFIEKTPRVRIRDMRFAPGSDYLNWASGFRGDGPNDEESREWCDKMLALLGYELPVT